MFKDSELSVFKKTILKELAGNQLWSVYASGGIWICPYCGQAGAHQGAPKEMLNEVMGHFAYKCPGWKKFHGRTMTMQALQRHTELFRLSRRMSKEENWDIRDTDGRWYCPGCGKRQNFRVPPGSKPSKRALELIVEHLDQCDEYKDGEPQLSADELQIAMRLCTDPAMRFYDRERFWYCPFALKQTKIKLDESRVVAREQILATAKHLKQTFEYHDRNGVPFELSFVKDAVKRGNRKREVFMALKDAVQNDPVWHVRGAKGNWKCPFCREEVLGVDISSPFMIRETAPYQMAAHLVDRCGAYRKGIRPARTVEELLTEEAPSPSSSMVMNRADYKAAAAAYDSLTSQGQGTMDAVMGARAESEEDIEAARRVQNMQDETLEKARQVQLQMLPDSPQYEGYDFQVLYKPCDHVGGDFYDFIHISDNEIGLVVGDVSGHGMDAALVMASAKKSLKIHGRTTSSPREALVIVNDDIRPELPPATFITVWYGVLNLQTRTLTFARAGHNPLVVYNPQREEKLLSFEPSGMILGMAKSAIFEKTLKEDTVQLVSGDLFFQYTDGLTEMMDPAREEFGIERLNDCFLRFGHEPPATFLSMLEADLAAFRSGQPIDDDVTMLAIKLM